MGHRQVCPACPSWANVNTIAARAARIRVLDMIPSLKYTTIRICPDYTFGNLANASGIRYNRNDDSPFHAAFGVPGEVATECPGAYAENPRGLLLS